MGFEVLAESLDRPGIEVRLPSGYPGGTGVAASPGAQMSQRLPQAYPGPEGSKKRRSFAGPKGGKLLSLMARILVRPVFLVVIALSLSLLAGCSGAPGDPYEQANGYIAEASEAINEHNGLFEEARGTYEEAKEAVEESGEAGSGDDPEEEVEEIAQARESLEEARDTLEEAREPLSEVQDLDVEDEITRYAALLAEGVDAQITAENREIGFYELLEQDPTLADNREEAEEMLTEISDGYEEAENSYSLAQELADANPELLQSEG